MYSILDVCHMLKLLRNSFSQLEVLRDSTGGYIKWFYIKRLQELQEEKTLALANTLKTSHIAWQKQKIKANLAAQTLSSSVAKALFCYTTTTTILQHEMKHPDFQGCDATIKFIETIDKLFDLLNSRLPWAKGYKSSLKASNETIWQPFLTSSMKYILSLRDVGGKNLWKTPKKTPFLGFPISIKSVIGIFDDFVCTGLISYFLTYKVSQDHLELFFCAVRSRNGWNNNPSALQFMRTFRKLLLHTDVSGGQGNCRVLDTTSILTVSSGTKNDPIINEIDMLPLRKSNITLETIIAEDHNYNIVKNFIGLDEYCENAVTYIAGYVVKMMKKTLHCSECLALIDKLEILFPGHNEHNFQLLKSTIYCYSKIRLHNLAKKYSSTIQGELVRKK